MDSLHFLHEVTVDMMNGSYVHNVGMREFLDLAELLPELLLELPLDELRAEDPKHNVVAALMGRSPDLPENAPTEEPIQPKVAEDRVCTEMATHDSPVFGCSYYARPRGKAHGARAATLELQGLNL